MTSVSSWQDLESTFWGSESKPMGALLLGNGYSINMWRPFAYSSLRDEAGLSPRALQVFGGRTDFERVLAELTITSSVVATIAPGYTGLVDLLGQLHGEVRDGLLNAVERVHPNQADLHTAGNSNGVFGVSASLDRDVLPQLGPLLSRYRRIFTTNYDLLTYWPSTEAGVADLFPGDEPFDVVQADSWLRNDYWPTKLLFLHGALHLTRDRRTGAEHKIVRQASNLLEAVRSNLEDPLYSPLFISEGTTEEKVASIRRSQYLSFASRVLRTTNLPLTVLGHSLSHQDAHICRALEAHPDRRIAIGVHLGASSSRDDALETSGRALAGRIPACNDVTVFDALEHPLTSEALVCQP